MARRQSSSALLALSSLAISLLPSPTARFATAQLAPLSSPSDNVERVATSLDADIELRTVNSRERVTGVQNLSLDPRRVSQGSSYFEDVGNTRISRESAADGWDPTGGTCGRTTWSRFLADLREECDAAIGRRLFLNAAGLEELGSTLGLLDTPDVARLQQDRPAATAGLPLGAPRVPTADAEGSLTDSSVPADRQRPPVMYQGVTEETVGGIGSWGPGPILVAGVEAWRPAADNAWFAQTAGMCYEAKRESASSAPPSGDARPAVDVLRGDVDDGGRDGLETIGSKGLGDILPDSAWCVGEACLAPEELAAHDPQADAKSDVLDDGAPAGRGGALASFAADAAVGLESAADVTATVPAKQLTTRVEGELERDTGDEGGETEGCIASEEADEQVVIPTNISAATEREETSTDRGESSAPASCERPGQSVESSVGEVTSPPQVKVREDPPPDATAASAEVVVGNVLPSVEPPSTDTLPSRGPLVKAVGKNDASAREKSSGADPRKVGMDKGKRTEIGREGGRIGGLGPEIGIGKNARYSPPWSFFYVLVFVVVASMYMQDNVPGWVPIFGRNPWEGWALHEDKTTASARSRTGSFCSGPPGGGLAQGGDSDADLPDLVLDDDLPPGSHGQNEGAAALGEGSAGDAGSSAEGGGLRDESVDATGGEAAAAADVDAAAADADAAAADADAAAADAKAATAAAARVAAIAAAEPVWDTRPKPYDHLVYDPVLGVIPAGVVDGWSRDAAERQEEQQGGEDGDRMLAGGTIDGGVSADGGGSTKPQLPPLRYTEKWDSRFPGPRSPGGFSNGNQNGNQNGHGRRSSRGGGPRSGGGAGGRRAATAAAEAVERVIASPPRANPATPAAVILQFDEIGGAASGSDSDRGRGGVAGRGGAAAGAGARAGGDGENLSDFSPDGVKGDLYFAELSASRPASTASPAVAYRVA